MFPPLLKRAVWLLFICGCAVLLLNPTQVLTSSSSEEAHNDNCIRLPPIPERSQIEGEIQMDIVNLLNGGSEDIKARISNGSAFFPEEAILILGNTGCGKTTLTQMLTSNLSRIHAVLTNSGDMVIVDDDDRIGAPTTISKTLTPELVPLKSSENTTIYFYDCPGFDDTRGPEQDLAANFFMNQIIRKVKRVKLLFLVTHSSLLQGNDRLDFDLLAKHATEFVRNLGPFEKSIGLVVTKVNGFSIYQRKFMKDKQILKGIGDFLQVYNHTLHQRLSHKQNSDEQNFIRRKIEFVKTLLQKDENGQFSRIAFSRTPDTCGPLSSSNEVNRTKILVTELYNNLEYSPVGRHQNFGYTLKENTILNIQVFAKQINKETTKMVENVVANFSEWFEQKKLNSSSNIDDTVALMQKSKPEIEKFAKDFLGDLVNFGRILSRSLSEIGYLGFENFEHFTVQQEDYLRFFDEATGTQVDRQFNDWNAPVVKFRQKFEHWFTSSVHTLSRQANKQVSIAVQECMDNFTVWFDKERIRAEESEQRFISFLEISKTEVENLSKNRSGSPVEIANSLNLSLGKIGYFVSEKFQEIMANYNGHLDYFDLNSEPKIDRYVGEWYAPIQIFQQKYKTWWNLHFHRFEKGINANITNTVGQFMSNVTAWLESENIHKDGNISVAIAFIERTRPEVGRMAEELANLSEFSGKLISSVLKLGYTDVGQSEKMLREQEFLLLGLENSTGVKVDRTVASWQEPVLLFQSHFNEWLGSVVQNLTQRVNNDISTAIGNTMESCWKWFTAESDKVATEANSAKMIDLLYSSKIDMQNLTIGLSNDPHKLSLHLKQFFEKLGYNSQDALEVVLAKQNEYLGYFDSIQGTPVDRNVSSWHSPIFVMQKRHQDWLYLSSQNVSKQINSKITAAVQETMLNFTKWFESTKPLANKNLKLLSVPTIQSVLSEIQSFLTNSTDSVGEFAQALRNVLQALGYNVPENFVYNLKQSEQVLIVLDETVNLRTEWALNDWKGPILVFQEKLKVYQQETSEHVSTLTQKANNDIVTEMNKEFIKFNEWFEREKFKDAFSVEQISSSMQTMLLNTQSLLINMPESPSAFSTAVKSALEKFGYRVDKQLEVFLSELENDFRFLDEAQGNSVRREVRQWSQPVLALKKKLEMYRNWYSFCGQLKTSMAIYEFHILGPEFMYRNGFMNLGLMKSLMLETDKVHWTRPQLLPIGSSGINWLQFLQQHKISVVDDNIKNAGSNLGYRHVKRLENIVRWSLAPVQISCVNNGKLLSVTGAFIRFGEFLNRHGNLKGSCSGATEVHIHAGDTAFIDTNLYGVGRQLNVVIIAPKWQVIGNPNFNLNGAMGENIYPNKAENGNDSSANGQNGKPGGPGGPGGNFVGVAESILEAGNLIISVSGGNGGKGQDGGDGTAGFKGETKEFSDWNFYLMVRDSTHGSRGQVGGRGGNGGNGGAGGHGGKPGNIYIKSKDASKVKMEKREGQNGADGVGGNGGQGGEGGVSYKCTKVYAWSVFPVNTDCSHSTAASGPDGKNGVNGVANEGLKYPQYPKSATDVKVASSEFRKMFQGNSNKETSAFIASLP